MNWNYRTLVGVENGDSCPIEAVNYFTAAGITDALVKSAYCQAVQYWKDNNVYSKIGACYPMATTSAFQAKWNSVNPVDSNAAFRRTFFGGITFDLMGEMGDGITGYAETFYSFFNETSSSTGAFLIVSNNYQSGVNRFDSYVEQVGFGGFGLRINEPNSTSSWANSLAGSLILNTNFTGIFSSIREPSSGNVIVRANGASAATSRPFLSAPNAGIVVHAGRSGASIFGYKNSKMTGYILGKNATESEVVLIENGLMLFNTILGRL